MLTLIFLYNFWKIDFLVEFIKIIFFNINFSIENIILKKIDI